MAQYGKTGDVFSQDNCKTFKKYFANLASDLVKKFPDPIGKFEIPLVRHYYKEN